MLRKWEEPLDPPNARHHPSPKAFSVHPEGGSFAAQRHKTSELLVFFVPLCNVARNGRCEGSVVCEMFEWEVRFLKTILGLRRIMH